MDINTQPVGDRGGSVSDWRVQAAVAATVAVREARLSDTTQPDFLDGQLLAKRRHQRDAVSVLVTLALVVLWVLGLTVGLAGPEPGKATIRAIAIAGWAAAGFAIWVQRRMLTPVLLGATASGAASALGAAMLASEGFGGNFGPARLLEYFGGALGIAMLLHAIVALPDGRLSNRTLRGIGITIYVVCIASATALLTLPEQTAHLAAEFAALAVVGVIAGSAAFALSRYHQLAAADRRTGQWIGAGAAVSAVLGVLVAISSTLLLWPKDAVLACAIATLPMPFAVATDETSLSGRSDKALVRALTWLGAVGSAGAIAIVVVVVIGHPPSLADRGYLGLALLAGILVLAAWNPIRQWSEARASHFTYGDRPPPDAALLALSSRLNRSVLFGQLLTELTEILFESQGSRGAAIWTGHGGTLELAASAGPLTLPPRISLDREAHDALAHEHLDGHPLVRGSRWASEHISSLIGPETDLNLRVAPVLHQGELLGLVLAARPGNGDPFSVSDERILRDTAVQLGLALHNIQLDSTLAAALVELRTQANELRASRSRLVAAANDERRRLERNLHDGAQQQLVGLAVTLGLARNLVASDPDEASKVLETATADVRAAIDELRSLARGIFPPLLVDRGIGEAVRAAARRASVEVSVTDDLSRRYPPDMEAAVYFCCLEALQNAAKHAPESSVTVSLADTPSELRFDVSDDGPGFDTATAVRGDGFVNMQDRLGALGGEIKVDSAPGCGTRLAGRIPVEADAPQGP